MKLYKLLYIVGVSVLFSACNSEEDFIVLDDALEIKGITASICNEPLSLTRADETKPLGVGRTEFVNDDKVVFTTIKRKDYALTPFTYSGIEYSYNGTWERTSNVPEKIYWSDVTSNHILAGYSLPILSSGTYPWTSVASSNITTYLGELGNGVAKNGTIDFSIGNDAIKNEDLLITYSDEIKASSSATVSFTHALSNVCVVVNIKDYAVNALDKDVDVLDMTILNQPCVIKWGGDSRALSTLNCDDENQKPKNIKLWRKNTSGDGQSKIFTFYGLTTPQNATYRGYDVNNNPLEFEFSVKYKDVTTGLEVPKTYHGSISGVEFNSGECTTINVSLSHSGEQMHIDVNYTDWNYVTTPDLGELRKKSTYMEMNVDNAAIKIYSQVDNADDASWLYNAGTTTDPVIKDIYGHTGTDSDPYIIKSAAQMLSFAKEVNNGYDFSGKTIRLDADITMQESATATDKSWGGIGVGENSKPFNGTFLGGDRYINRLKGNPLFVNLGTSAVVEQLHIAPIGTLDGGGALAGTNAGTIGGCKVVDDIALSTEGGALVGTNNGTIHACYHIGNATYQKDKNTSVSLGLVGSNTGSIIGCYHAGDVFTIVTDNTGSTGTIECPKHESLYLIQQTAFVEALNEKLKGWYPEEETTYTKFQFKHKDASYPTVTKDKPNN